MVYRNKRFACICSSCLGEHVEQLLRVSCANETQMKQSSQCCPSHLAICWTFITTVATVDVMQELYASCAPIICKLNQVAHVGLSNNCCVQFMQYIKGKLSSLCCLHFFYNFGISALCCCCAFITTRVTARDFYLRCQRRPWAGDRKRAKLLASSLSHVVPGPVYSR